MSIYFNFQSTEKTEFYNKFENNTNKFAQSCLRYDSNKHHIQD